MQAGTAQEWQGAPQEASTRSESAASGFRRWMQQMLLDGGAHDFGSGSPPEATKFIYSPSRKQTCCSNNVADSRSGLTEASTLQAGQLPVSPSNEIEVCPSERCRTSRQDRSLVDRVGVCWRYSFLASQRERVVGNRY